MSVRRLAPPEVQPKEFSFSKDNLAWANEQVKKYPEGRQASAIILLLWRAQEQAGGWLPEAAIRYVSDFLGMAHIRALEVATFYTMFNLQPVGKFHVQLCGTTPCRLRGADDLEKVCRKRIGEQMEVTKDGKFSWVEVECLGACVNAPMAQINYDYYEDLTEESFDKLLDNLAAGKKVKPGPQIERQLSAPVGTYHVQFCGTTPCMLRGADGLKKVLHRLIGEENEVTADGKFSWVEVECLGACVNAPMVQINADYYEDLTPDILSGIINDLSNGKAPKPGPQIDRQNSAPIGGPTTLTDPSPYDDSQTSGPVSAALLDEEGKKPGAAANVHESPLPKPPVADATDPRR